MLTQTTFIDVDEYRAPLARASDPATSHVAIPDEPRLSTLKSAALRSARELCRLYGDCTANEIAAHAADGVIGAESVRKRVNELYRSGLLTESATRACRVSGKLATAYRAPSPSLTASAP